MNSEELGYMYQSLIAEGEALLKSLQDNLSHISGINKLQQKIKKDNNFLAEALLQNKVKKEHIACTNLNFYKGLVEELFSQEDPDSVLETFLYQTDDRVNARITVDIVSENGGKWTKIVARNPSALQNIYKDGNGFGRRSILDQANSYVQAASQNLHHYAPPQVLFSFINGVPEEMNLYLQKAGIEVKGQVLALENGANKSNNFFSENEDDDDEENVVDNNTIGKNNVPIFSDPQKTTNKLNLCVTTMMAYVSALTNGGCYKSFAEPLLKQQAEWERMRPLKPLLDGLFQGKVLIACSTAVADFRNIIEHIGGVEEKKRATALLATLDVVPDVTFAGLKLSGQIKKRSLVIFGTGHHHRAITVTANKGFVFASKQKGVKFAVIVHESRALTECKELHHPS